MRAKRIMTAAVLTVGCLALAGWYIVDRYGARFGLYTQAPSAEKYIETALGMMDNGIYATGEEWKEARREAAEEAKSAKSYEDAHDILKKALKAAGGKHSQLIVPLSVPKPAKEATEASASGEKRTSMAEMREDGICYIRLTEMSGDAREAKEYVDNIYKVLRENQKEIKGAIIDLRHNTGGDMGPMVTAVGPLLPEGKLMSFGVRGQEYPVEIKEGTVTGGGNSVKIDDPIKIEQTKIAILQDTLTASSGEATLICFRGLENTKTFGTKSAGYCSSNMVYRLYDGTMMVLTIGEDIARTGEHFSEDPIAPDMETDKAEEEAIRWLKETMK